MRRATEIRRGPGVRRASGKSLWPPCVVLSAHCFGHGPGMARTLFTRNFTGGLPPAAGPLAAAIAAWFGSMAPAWAATLGDGYKPPTICTRRDATPDTSTCWPTYSRTFVPTSLYVVPCLLPCLVSDSVNRPVSLGLALMHPLSVSGFAGCFVFAVADS